eukprot:m.205380 g.205380  ORF g.205380 m.205380 type:complete len:778 (+) comp17094_c0_seq23:186-2519(+)
MAAFENISTKREPLSKHMRQSVSAPIESSHRNFSVLLKQALFNQSYLLESLVSFQHLPTAALMDSYQDGLEELGRGFSNPNSIDSLNRMIALVEQPIANFCTALHATYKSRQSVAKTVQRFSEATCQLGLSLDALLGIGPTLFKKDFELQSAELYGTVVSLDEALPEMQRELELAIKHATTSQVNAGLVNAAYYGHQDLDFDDQVALAFLHDRLKRIQQNGTGMEEVEAMQHTCKFLTVRAMCPNSDLDLHDGSKRRISNQCDVMAEFCAGLASRMKGKQRTLRVDSLTDLNLPALNKTPMQISQMEEVFDLMVVEAFIYNALHDSDAIDHEPYQLCMLRNSDVLTDSMKKLFLSVDRQLPRNHRRAVELEHWQASSFQEDVTITQWDALLKHRNAAPLYRAVRIVQADEEGHKPAKPSCLIVVTTQPMLLTQPQSIAGYYWKASRAPALFGRELDAISINESVLVLPRVVVLNKDDPTILYLGTPDLTLEENGGYCTLKELCVSGTFKDPLQAHKATTLILESTRRMHTDDKHAHGDAHWTNWMLPKTLDSPALLIDTEGILPLGQYHLTANWRLLTGLAPPYEARLKTHQAVKIQADLDYLSLFYCVISILIDIEDTTKPDCEDSFAIVSARQFVPSMLTRAEAALLANTGGIVVKPRIEEGLGLILDACPGLKVLMEQLARSELGSNDVVMELQAKLDSANAILVAQRLSTRTGKKAIFARSLDFEHKGRVLEAESVQTAVRVVRQLALVENTKQDAGQLLEEAISEMSLQGAV